ncbi:MAG: CBS domain-containing protein [Actinomycetota bacterium]|nr:CBS domain-containing protein [Actinomycetota bacterium]
MEIGPLITRAVLTVEESDTVRDAAEWMMERGVGSAVVLSEGKPSGIITDRDTLRIVAQGADGNAITVGDCLTRKLVTATPDMKVLEAARIMREKGFRHLVVVDDAGALAGLFSMRDLVVGLLQERDTLTRQAPGADGPAPATE